MHNLGHLLGDYMKHIKLRRYDLPEEYNAVYYTDGYLMTPDEPNDIEVAYADILDVYSKYGRCVENSYE